MNYIVKYCNMSVVFVSSSIAAWPCLPFCQEVFVNESTLATKRQNWSLVRDAISAAATSEELAAKLQMAFDQTYCL